MSTRHYNVLVKIYELVYNGFPDFDQIFDEETFYISAFAITIVSIATCFVLSRFITLREADI
ncbi:LSM12-like protein [Sarcoptes scabiei]|uniref:Uncharacterized protein n=1 Tax=Sarcoptes scabiei TaxID=52283 RepID=A0A132AF80_SARSC|nr:hypothetical protein QR98_0077480 [Sarcoptes scabiei]UXI21013.1 LSM12-like protein [Sarcoptes scabiei]